MHGMVMMSHAWYGDGESCKVLMSHAFMHGDDDMGHTPYPTCMGHTPYPLPVFSGNRASAGRSRHPACPG